MQWVMNSRIAALSLLGAACFAACAENTKPSTAESAVDAAYAALVSDIANCAKEVKTCTDAAADDAAVDACRDQFATCREDAGKKNVNVLADAVRSCTSAHKDCVRAADSGEADSCQDELRVCLRAARPEKDDDDAGTDKDERKAAREDCLDELHPCVKAEGPANVCAEQVRTCLVESVPTSGEVVPEDGDDADDDAVSDDAAASDEDGMGMGMGMGAKSDAGATRGKSAAAKAAKDADAGVSGAGTMNQAQICVDTLRTCIDAGNPARGCAKSLKECRAAATP